VKFILRSCPKTAKKPSKNVKKAVQNEKCRHDIIGNSKFLNFGQKLTPDAPYKNLNLKNI